MSMRWPGVALVTLTLACMGSEMHAQAPSGQMTGEPRRLALVIGNDRYPAATLKNAGNDARAMGAALADVGFTVQTGFDLSLAGLDAAVSKFVETLSPGITALVYYAGHGIQIDGENYLLPIDFEARDETEARYRAYSATRLYERVVARGVGLHIVILDACRDNPFRAVRSSARGLATMASAQRGGLLAFATAPGGVADDSPQSINSVFTAQLLEAMFEPGLSLEQLFFRVRQRVVRLTNGRQVPWTNSSVLEEFSFVPRANTTPNEPLDTRETVFWEVVNTTDAPELLESYLGQYPQGRYATLARVKLNLLREMGIRSLAAASANNPRKSVALLGYRNLTGREAVEWIGTALTESLSVELALGEQLRVLDPAIATRSTLRGTTAPTGKPVEANDLGPDLTISGSYLVAPGDTSQIRVNTTIAERGGRNVGAFSLSGVQSDLIPLIAQIGERVRALIQARPKNDAQAAVLAGALPLTQEVAQSFAEALDRFRRFDLMGANELLQTAVAREPNFAMAYARLSETWAGLGFDTRAREAVARARELSAGLPREQRLAIDLQYFRANSDWVKAVDVGRALVGLFPDDVDYAITLANVRIQAAEFKGALEGVDTLLASLPSARNDPRVALVEANAARAVSDYERSLRAGQQAATIAVGIDASQIGAHAKLAVAWALKRLGRLDESIQANEEARRLFAAAGDRSGMSAAILQLASDLREQGQHDRAGALYGEALELSRAVGDRRGLASTSNNLAVLRYGQRRLAEAQEHYEQALAVYKEMQDKAGIATVLSNLAAVLAERGMPEAALTRDKEALTLRREIGAPRGIAVTLYNMAEGAIDRLELQSAASMYSEAHDIFEQIRDQRNAAGALVGLATAQYWQGLLAPARLAAERALAMQSAAGNARIAITRLLLARIATAEGSCETGLGLASEVRASASPDAEISALAAAAQASALTCLGRLEPAAEAAAIDVPNAPQHAAMELAAARIAVSMVQGRDTDIVTSITALRELANSAGSRLWHLVADVYELQHAARTGQVSAERAQDVQRRAAAGGAGLLLSRIQDAVTKRQPPAPAIR